MVRLAPSAVNRQPWRILVDQNCVHFYLKRTKGFNGGKIDMQKIDMGIALCHFDLMCEELGIKCGKGVVPPLGGATDSAAFAQAGMRSTGITALNHALPDFYHTRLDTPDELNKGCLADCFAASVKVLEMFDNGAKQ